MAAGDTQATRLLQRIEAAWAALRASYAGLPPACLTEPGVAGDWSVKDVLAHVTTWEDEALRHLPVIIEGGRPPRYVTYGGIDAFNARTTAEKRAYSLTHVLRQLDETHDRLLAFIASMPEDQLRAGSRARRRLRLDTYGHYPQHTEAIRTWRFGKEAGLGEAGGRGRAGETPAE
jgi:hypothetical protein